MKLELLFIKAMTKQKPPNVENFQGPRLLRDVKEMDRVLENSIFKISLFTSQPHLTALKLKNLKALSGLEEFVKEMIFEKLSMQAAERAFSKNGFEIKDKLDFTKKFYESFLDVIKVLKTVSPSLEKCYILFVFFRSEKKKSIVMATSGYIGEERLLTKTTNIQKE